jgi:CheY-like chemotaxis protein
MSEAILTPVLSREETPTHSAERRALVVDDDSGIRTLVVTVLRREGFTIDAAVNGRDALTLLAERAYAIIILDLAMPGMNGVQLLEYLRHRDAQTLRRVLVITASIPRVRPELPPDVCHILTKPFDLSEFQAAVARCVAELDS